MEDIRNKHQKLVMDAIEKLMVNGECNYTKLETGLSAVMHETALIVHLNTLERLGHVTWDRVSEKITIGKKTVDERTALAANVIDEMGLIMVYVAKMIPDNLMMSVSEFTKKMEPKLKYSNMKDHLERLEMFGFIKIDGDILTLIPEEK